MHAPRSRRQTRLWTATSAPPSRRRGLAPSCLRATAVSVVSAIAIGGTASVTNALAPAIDDARELALVLRKLDQTRRVLYVTAHPDDEDAGLLARLVHRDGAEVALLTLTRGEGGQNEIGTELFDALGVLRGRELESAAAYTGVTQFFSRAFEFGYSFSVEETYEKWDEESILRDVVAVVREWRPDVVLTMLDDGPGGGQHHQASARLARRAFDVAATPQWPELGEPHAAARLFRQEWDPEAEIENEVRIPLGVVDPILGASYARVGLASRAQHKCQGMAATFEPLASRESRWRWAASRGEPLGDLPAFWAGLPEPLVEDEQGPTAFGRELAARVADVRAAYDPETPEDLVDPLISLWRVIHAARAGAEDATDRCRLDTLAERAAHAIGIAMGLDVVVRADRASVGPDAELTLDVAMRHRLARPVEVGLTLSGDVARALAGSADGDATGADPGDALARGTWRRSLAPGETRRERVTLGTRADAEPTCARAVPRRGNAIAEAEAARFRRPRWTAFVARPTLFHGDDAIALPEVRVVHQTIDAELPTVREVDVHVVPDPGVRILADALAVPLSGDADGVAEIDVEVTSLAGGVVAAGLDVPAGWSVSPGELTFALEPGEVERGRFTLEVPRSSATTTTIGAWVRSEASGAVRRDGVQAIDYPHVRRAWLVRPAVSNVSTFPCARASGLRVGYVDGAGDRTREAIETLGHAVDRLDSTTLLEGDLSDYDVIVTGVRAYKVRADLAAAQDRLVRWMDAGGVLVVQYNKFEFNDGRHDSPFTPYGAARVGRGRVTVEESPVQVNVPDHPVFITPNRLGEADWSGWVQERGLYFLETDDPRYVDLLTLEDPWPYNAGPRTGGLVHARVGHGHWVYVGVGLFRQLPSGVPGAYRLLANLLALGRGEGKGL